MKFWLTWLIAMSVVACSRTPVSKPALSADGLVWCVPLEVKDKHRVIRSAVCLETQSLCNEAKAAAKKLGFAGVHTVGDCFDQTPTRTHCCVLPSSTERQLLWALVWAWRAADW